MKTPTTFELFATIIFALAIVHTLLSTLIFEWSRSLASRRVEGTRNWKYYHFFSELTYLLSEVEVIFGFWILPIFGWFIAHRGWGTFVDYINARDFTAAYYIMVIVVVIASRPIVTFVERVMEWIARLGKDTPGAWWWTILTIGPLLGSLIKEPGAMTICALLLAAKFYHYNPPKSFQYATMGLLFANISVGGMLSSFSSRALFFVAKDWEWSSWDLMRMFGWKAVVGILIANASYYFIFRKGFVENFPEKIPALEKEESKRPTPFWITLIHILFVAAIVFTGESRTLFLGVFLIFLAFHRATSFYQGKLHLKAAILVAFFFASLIIHGELQGWWIIPLIKNTSNFATAVISFVLSAFADNATLGYLVVDIPNLEHIERYLIVAGYMAAGGLTVIANAPNPIGLSILRPAFKGHVSFFKFFMGALPPSLLYFFIFWILK